MTDFFFDFLVFVNHANQPIAGFDYYEQALEWAESHYTDFEIRNRQGEVVT